MLRTYIPIQVFSTVVSLTIILITPFVSQPVSQQTPTFEATAIESEYWIPPLLGYDPHLICPKLGSHQEGASWNNLKVGSSSLSEFEQILYSMGVYEKTVRTDQSNLISIGYSLQTETPSLNDELPVDVEVCAEENIVTVMVLLFGNQKNPLYLMHFAREYDMPDVVTWTPSVQSRIAFWFEKGVAAEIFVGTQDRVSFGRIFRVIYFPYQNKRGYEQRWPYNRTWPIKHEDDGNGTPIEQNPFDFEALLMIITPQPIRTATATFQSHPTETPASATIEATEP